MTGYLHGASVVAGSIAATANISAAISGIGEADGFASDESPAPRGGTDPCTEFPTTYEATLTLLNGSYPGTLTRITVLPFVRENLPSRATLLKVATTGGALVAMLGPRLRKTHLFAQDSTSNRKYYGAVKDQNDVWSEYSDGYNYSAVSFVSGSTEGSIGSGTRTDVLLEEPSLFWPDLNLGSGIIRSWRTIVADDEFRSETRTSKRGCPRVSIRVVLNNLDESQTVLLHKFYRQLNGPFKPFYYEYKDPVTSALTKYIVRFRDPELADDMFAIDRSNMEFNLVEVHTDGHGSV